MPKYIKDYVAEVGTLPLQIVSIGSPTENRNGKMVRRTEFKMKSTGETIVESLLETTFKYDLKDAEVGNNLEAYMKDNGYIGYKILRSSGGEMLDQPSQSNYKQVQVERKVTESKRQDDEYWAKKDIAASLGMLLKIAMPICGQDFDKALKQALEWKPKFSDAITKAYNEDKFGFEPSELSPALDDAEIPF